MSTSYPPGILASELNHSHCRPALGSPPCGMQAERGPDCRCLLPDLTPSLSQASPRSPRAGAPRSADCRSWADAAAWVEHGAHPGGPALQGLPGRGWRRFWRRKESFCWKGCGGTGAAEVTARSRSRARGLCRRRRRGGTVHA